MNRYNQQSRNAVTPRKGFNKKLSVKGLFKDGIWMCDCNPRQPAAHYETKKPGPNQGKWFYCCQKRREDPECCSFFLWEADSKAREEGAVLSNSRTEPALTYEPTTPSRRLPAASTQDNHPMTPYSNSKAAARLTSDTRQTPLTPFLTSYQKTARENPWLNVSDDELDDNDLKTLADEAAMPPPETPSKVPQPATPTSLGKRHFDGAHVANGDIKHPTPSIREDPFVTPNAKFQKRDSMTAVAGSAETGPGSLMTPGDTQRTSRTGPPRTATPSSMSDSSTLRDESPLGRKSTNFLDNSTFGLDSSKDPEPPVTELATEVLETLRDLNISLSKEAVNAVKKIAYRQVTKMRAVEKGRDVSRDGLRRRDARIKELEEEVMRLKGLGLGGRMTK